MKETWTVIKSKQYSIKTDPKLIASVNRRPTLLLCVLNHYQILHLLEMRGREHVGQCPFRVPKQADHGPFRVEKQTGRWRCEGCECEGRVVEFVSRMERIAPQLAAVLICSWFPRSWPSRIIQP